MADKIIKQHFTETGINVYCTIEEDSTEDFYDINDGAFRGYSDPDNYFVLTEHTYIKGLYVETIPDAGEPAWDDGRYTVTIYKQTGGSPVPASDVIIGHGDMYIVSDTEIVLNADVSALATSAELTTHDAKLDVVDGNVDDIESRVNEIAFQNRMVWVDTVSGSAGTTYPLGTALNPVDNFANALTIANANNINSFNITGSITIGGSDDVSGMTFQSDGKHSTIVLTAGCTTLNTEFRGHIHLSGIFNGHVHCFNNHLAPSTALEGFFIDCLFDEGNYSVGSNTISRFIKCNSSGQQGQSVSLDTTGATTDLAIWLWTGKIEITDKTGSTTFDVEMMSGELDIDASCVDGVINVRGLAEVSDNSSAGCNVVDDKLLIKQVDSELSTVHGAGTWDIADVIADLNEIKGSSWVDENLTTIESIVNSINTKTTNLPTDPASETNVNANETKIDSLDTQVKRILGLLHENVKYTNPSYDGDNNLEQVTITIYDDNNLTNAIASYTWTSTGDGAGKFSIAQQVKN